MQYKYLAAVAALAGTSVAQRPANVSICDYYTAALLTNNTPANQYTLLTLVVNTAVIGNYTQPNVGIAVPGILTPGTYNGVAVNLLPYFDGGLDSTSNINTSLPVAVNFLDDGGATPLMKNMPANTNSSAQYTLLTHLYQYFGVLLGCSGVGTADFPSYAGRGSQYTVHKYMDLDSAQVGYFITQVGLAAASFGVATADVTAVGEALEKIFDVRCAPPTTVVPAQGAQLQSICITEDCPLAANATCSAYAANVVPTVANATLADGLGMNSTSSSSSMAAGSSSTGTAASSSATGSATGSSTSTGTGVAKYTGAAEALKAQAGAVIGGAAALAAFVL